MASSVALVYFRATAAFPRTQHLRQSATSSAAKVRSRNHVNPMADVAERRGGCQTRSKSSDALPNQDGKPHPSLWLGPVHICKCSGSAPSSFT